MFKQLTSANRDFMNEASSEFFEDDLRASGSTGVAGSEYIFGEEIYVSETGFTQLHLLRRLGRLFIAKSLRSGYRGNEAAEAALRKEFQIGFKIDCKGAVRTFDFSSHPATGSFIVLEYCRGINLRELMDSEKKITGECLENISSSLISTVSAIHGEGIIHRDIKPSNIIYDEVGGGVKLIDFGCADAFDQSMFKGSAGTEFYKSEDFTNQPADDWYALSLTLTELAEHCNDRGAANRVLALCNNMRKGESPEGKKPKRTRNGFRIVLAAAALLITCIISVFLLHKTAQSPDKKELSSTHQQAIKFIDKRIKMTTHDVYVDRLMKLMDQMEIYGVYSREIESINYELSDEEEVTRSVLARIRPFFSHLPNDLPRDTINQIIKHYYQVYFVVDGIPTLVTPEEQDSINDLILSQQKVR